MGKREYRRFTAEQKLEILRDTKFPLIGTTRFPGMGTT